MRDVPALTVSRPATVAAVASRAGSSVGRHVVVWLLMPPLILLAGKLPAAPTSKFLSEYESLLILPATVQHRLSTILFLPLGALLVVLFRLTLGISVLGPFRSVLLALAFISTGIWLGLLFTAVIVAAIVVVRQFIEALGMPYFGRISVMFSAVVLLMVGGTVSGVMLQSNALIDIERFPVVVLCLIGEAIALAIKQDGLHSGLWRAASTALLAVMVASLAFIPHLSQMLLRFPELLLVEVALIVFVSRHCAWRLLEHLNPKRAPEAPGWGPSSLQRLTGEMEP